MSEQQKDSSADGATDAVPSAQASGQPVQASVEHAGADITKPKRRSSSKARAATEVGDEPAKPAKLKRTRSSTRSTKPGSVLEGQEPPLAGAPSVEGAALVDQGELPPLPPAPVPTPEGVAFMQQHAVYQGALEKRMQLQHERLTRSLEAANGSEQKAGGQGASTVRRLETKVQGTGSREESGVAGATMARKPAASRHTKAEVENSIEPGPEIRREQVSEAEIQVMKDAEDVGLLRKLLDRSKALIGARNAAPTGERGAAAAQSDVETLRTIKDALTRRLGLAVADRNRQAESEYRKEFDKLAPDLKNAARDVGASASAVVPPPSTPAGEPVVTAKAASTAVPDSVSKRFLRVDSEYYFPDRSPAFVDRGAKLATRGEHPEVVAALIEIARERGWNSVTVKGTETFRRAAWMEAARNGLQVDGYKPSRLDLAQLNQNEPRNLVEPSALREQSTKRPTSPEKPSDKSEESALGEKLSAFANDKPTLAVKKYPELVQAYALLDAARKFAKAYMPEQEAQFVAIGKELIAQQIREGKDVIGPKVDAEQLRQPRRQKPDVTVVRPDTPVHER